MAFSLVKALQRRDASKALLAIAEAGESGQGPAANAPAAWLEKLRQPLPILRERIDPCDKLSGIFEAPLLGEGPVPVQDRGHRAFCRGDIHVMTWG